MKTSIRDKQIICTIGYGPSRHAHKHQLIGNQSQESPGTMTRYGSNHLFSHSKSRIVAVLAPLQMASSGNNPGYTKSLQRLIHTYTKILFRNTKKCTRAKNRRRSRSRSRSRSQRMKINFILSGIGKPLLP